MMQSHNALQLVKMFVCGDCVFFRAGSLQIEMEQMRNQHEDSLEKLQARHNADMSHFQQEHTLSAAKASSLTSHTLHMLYSLLFPVVDDRFTFTEPLSELTL